MRFHPGLLMLVAVTAALMTGNFAAAQGAGPQPAPVAPLDRLSAQLAKAGVKRCAPIVRAVAAFVTENSKAAFVVRSLGAVPDTAPAVVTVESAHAALGTTRYATISVVPSENCSGFYEQTIYWPAACPAVKAQYFANFPATKPILKNIQLSAASPTVSLQLMPAGTGCVTMKKEIFR